MSLENQLYIADEEVRRAHAVKGDIARRIHAASEASSSNLEYDAFLSFRGLDTRKKFTDHLCKALKEEGFRIFRDDDEIETGENIKSALQKAIRNSRMSVIVVSKNYHNSSACLFELQTILQHQKTSDHIILPVFYDVDPSEIKEQAEKLNFEKKTTEEVKEWSAALKELARMKGKVSLNEFNGYETKLIEDIVEDIHTKFVKIKIPDILRERWVWLYQSTMYLSGQADDVRAKVDTEMHQMWKTPMKKVVVWLRHVESFKDDVEILKQEVFGERRVHSHAELRKKIDEKIQEAAVLEKRGRAFKDNLLVAFPFPIGGGQLMPLTNLESVMARNAVRIREYSSETLSVM